MKNFLKLLSVMLVLFSTLSFAQADDCLPNLPFQIGKPIKTDQYTWSFGRSMDQTRMVSYLVNFNNSFKRYSAGGSVPSSFVETVDKIDSKYYSLTNELVAKSTDFTSFRVNILNKLKASKNPAEIEALILMDYSVQIVEISGLHSRTSSLSWDCIGTTIGFSSSSVMMDTSTDIIGDQSGGIAGGGCTPSFPFPRPKPCR